MTFKRGDRVQVRKLTLYTSGKTGTVLWSNSSEVRVEIDNMGFYTYRPSSLRLVMGNTDAETTYNNNNKNNKNKGENNMLMGNYKVCKVKFLEGANTNKEYNYALYDNTIFEGDHVVVKSAHHGFGVAVVTELISDEYVTETVRDYCNEGREIVSKFDMRDYEYRLENRKVAKQLKADMDKKMKEMQELAMFEMMAEKNPELKEMLEKYKELIA